MCIIADKTGRTRRFETIKNHQRICSDWPHAYIKKKALADTVTVTRDKQELVKKIFQVSPESTDLLKLSRDTPNVQRVNSVSLSLVYLDVCSRPSSLSY